MGFLPSFLSTPREQKLDFIKLPSLLQYKIVEKLTYQQAVVFENCSLASKVLMDSYKLKFVFTAFALKYLENGNHRVYETATRAYEENAAGDFDYQFGGAPTVRLVLNRIILKCQLTDKKCAQIVKDLRRGGVKASLVSYYPHNRQTCSPEALDSIIQAAGATAIHCSKGIDVMFLHSPVIQKLNRLVIFDCLELYDSVFLALSSREIEIRDSLVSGGALNSIFKEWRQGNREIDLLRIFNPIEDFDEMFEDLPAKLEWTRSRSGKIGHVSHALWKRPKEIYVLGREGDNEKLYISVRDKCIKVIRKGKLKKNKELCFNMLDLIQ